MFHPKDTDAIESEKVKTVLPSPSINYLSGENSSTAPISKKTCTVKPTAMEITSVDP